MDRCFILVIELNDDGDISTNALAFSTEKKANAQLNVEKEKFLEKVRKQYNDPNTDFDIDEVDDGEVFVRVTNEDYYLYLRVVDRMIN